MSLKNPQNKHFDFARRVSNFSTIKAKFIVPISLTLVILFALLVIGFIRHQNRKAHLELNNDIEMITALETELLNIPVWNYNEEHINEVARFSFNNKEVVYIKVYDDEEGTDLLSHYCRDKEWGVITCNNDSIMDDPYLITQRAYLNRIVDDKKIVIGLMEIGFTGKFYQKEKITTALFMTLFGLFSLAIVIGLLTLIINFITNPIKELTGIVVGSFGIKSDKAMLTKIISSSNRLENAEIYSNDETGKLAFAFNIMMKQLRGSLEDLRREMAERRKAEELLQKAYDQQEIRIQERTAKLADANEKLELKIKERRQAGEALQKSEEKYRTILENIEDGYYEIDFEGNFTFFNDSMTRILGYPKEELMGMNNRQYMDKENAKKVFEAFNSVYRTGKSYRAFDWELIRKDGSRRYVEASVSLRRDSNDQGAGFRGIARDVTERKLSEEEKEKLEAQLVHAQRMEAIGTLAGGIAHNFNNLLMGIMGNASIMLLDIDAGHPHYKNLKAIEEQVHNGSKLTAQLIGFAMEGRYEVKPINLNRIVKETSDTFGSTRKEIMVHQELSDNLYGIRADQGQIEQILLNLYINAADAMPEGGNLFLKTLNVTHDDMAGKNYKPKPGNYALLTVRDDGAGMDKETIERIFEPFFTTKGLASGTGLGLASAYGIIKGHGGFVDVESEKNHGTTFSIYLPATEEHAEDKKESSNELLKGRETVLLVDDEEIILDIGEQILKTMDYEVLLAGGGREALELYEKNRDSIDIVLLDMVMPVNGGGETYDRLKELNPAVKVILASGYSIDGKAKEILNRGCDGFIQKPFTMNELSQKLREILDKE